ncbi:MAG: hypothetical protein CMJ89_03560 [Planctomycetes bacterium]|jgi:hypothetical protein|nr:hypothetical protein [Planctomycetota bacterium]
MFEDPERRLFTRVAARLEADLETQDGLELRGVLTNLSVRGFFLQTQEFAPLGSECRIQLYPLGRSRGALVASGRIVREGQEGLGIEFENLPHETFESVRTLILGSAEEPELVENELLNRLSMPPGQY